MTINFDRSNINVGKHVKISDVNFDRYMSFNTHIHHLNKKVIGVILFLNRVMDIFGKDTRVIVIKTLVLSLINYGLKIWGNTNDTLMQRVQKLKKTSLPKLLPGVTKDVTVLPLCYMNYSG